MEEENEDGGETTFKTKKKAKELEPALNRPIILVCNDAYARALAPMKNIVQRLQVHCASDNKLQNRIC